MSHKTSNNFQSGLALIGLYSTNGVCIKQTCCESFFEYDLGIKVYHANCIYLPFVVQILGLNEK